MKKTESMLEIEGRQVRVSNLQKIYYPATGFTKGGVLDYYINIAPVFLAHLKDRPVSLKRYPDGVKGLFFYEKQCPVHRPDWVQTTPIWSDVRKAKIGYCVFNDLPSLVWAANLAVLEFHTSLSRKQDMTKPDFLAFDLDPGDGMNISACCKVAVLIEEKLRELKLKCFAKTSGSKGLQLYVPLNSKADYEQTKTLAHDLAIELEQAHPELVVSKMSKALRKGKIFIDWSQNDEHKTTVCAYSLRAKERPSASTPLKWEEVEAAARSRSKQPLFFSPADVLKRVEKFGDLFAPVLKLKQSVPKLEVASQ